MLMLGAISNCYNKGEVENNGCRYATSTANIGMAAGIAGANQLGNVVNCYNKGTIKSLPSAEDQRGSIAGGVVGANYGNIGNTYNGGSIITNGNSYVTIGGIVAWEHPTSTTRYINYVYNIGKLNEEQSQNENSVVRGGVLGLAGSKGAIWTNFYWLESTGATWAAGGGTGDDPSRYTSEQIKNLISSGGLPDTDWATDSNINSGYPHLKVFDDTSIWLRDNKNDGDPYLKENLPQ